jgi:hypothetical protein
MRPTGCDVIVDLLFVVLPVINTKFNFSGTERE